MKKFDLLDLITRLGEAVLSGSGKKTAEQTDQNADVAGGFVKTETQKPMPASDLKQPSTSEQAVVEMLRRHDKKSKEIDEKIKAAHDKNGD